MGHANWRRDALLIVGLSLVPALLMMVSRWDDFPWPGLRDAIYFSGLLGLVFGLLQCWVLIKLLREWWGEPDECVAWWPPLALLLQCSLLLGAMVRIFGSAHN
jgi:hypothetical protein